VKAVAAVIAPMLLSVFSAVLAGPSPGPGPVPHGSPQAAADAWGSIRFLVGDWVGEGSGQPGAGRGSFSFRFALEDKVLVRRDHSEYPAGGGRPSVVHDALMIVYPEPGHRRLAAIYFDNEGHVIRYQVGTEGGGHRIAFFSEPTAGAPRFRLTYARMTDDAVDVTFEIAPPDQPDAFKQYIGGRSRRVTKN